MRRPLSRPPPPGSSGGTCSRVMAMMPFCPVTALADIWPRVRGRLQAAIRQRVEPVGGTHGEGPPSCCSCHSSAAWLVLPPAVCCCYGRSEWACHKPRRQSRRRQERCSCLGPACRVRGRRASEGAAGSLHSLCRCCKSAAAAAAAAAASLSVMAPLSPSISQHHRAPADQGAAGCRRSQRAQRGARLGAHGRRHVRE